MRSLLLIMCLAGCAGCGPSFASRYGAGNQNLSTDEGAVYFVVLAPLLQQALNDCIPPGMRDASPVLVVVADIEASGTARDIDIEPDGPGTDCVHDRLAQARFHRPPLAAGATSYPIGLRIDTR